MPDKRSVRKTFSQLFRPQFIQDWMALWKARGFKEFVRQKGWKVVAAVFLFYLVRDSILYILIPVLAARGLLGC